MFAISASSSPDNSRLHVLALLNWLRNDSPSVEGGEHGHIQQISFPRVIMVAFGRQDVERGGQTRSSLVRVTLHRGRGGRDNLVLEVDFVQIAGVSQFSRQELDLQEAIAQRQKVGDQGCRRQVKPPFPGGPTAASMIRDRSSWLEIRQAASDSARCRNPVGSCDWLTPGTTINLFVTSSGGESARYQLGIFPVLAIRRRVPEGRPSRQESRRIITLVVRREVLEAVAGQQNDKLLVIHGFVAYSW